MVMLSEISEQAIFNNLKTRYTQGHIYTGIGQVLVAVNPYKNLNCFSRDKIELYHGKQPFEIPPHVFSVTDDAYRNLITDGENQAIIITGESGAGKTESAKGAMVYLAAVSGGGENVDRTKEIVLNSNPMLESFGNAKTLRNNNSSRFGKYIEIQFDFKGDPRGGRITTYLLEKSRIAGQIPGERNFHIFYQLFASGQGNKWGLGDISTYKYMSNGSMTAEGISDANDFRETVEAMGKCGISPEEIEQVLSVTAGILHLGNVQFTAAGEASKVANPPAVQAAAKCFGVAPQALDKALVSRTIKEVSGKVIHVPNKKPQAEFARDALARGIFSRIFSFLVNRANRAFIWNPKGVTIGILDIYGFEIFDVNSFEQIVINTVNESLHGVFVELTLKREQAEYASEGIPWENVEYTDNSQCIQLITGKPMGILALLDEEAIVPRGSDKAFHDKITQHLTRNPHFVPPGRLKTTDLQFGVKHYAGTVQYKCEGLIEKNRDLMFDSLTQCVLTSNMAVLKESFKADADKLAAASSGGKKRPTTAGAQFKVSLQELLTLLYQCNPHYIRCIKPNESKSPLVCEDDRVLEQIRYLGLFENLKIRRAGFAYRKDYSVWLQRYYILTAATFPAWQKNFRSPRDAVEHLMQHIGLQPGQYAMGKTKLFIKDPESVYVVERARIEGLNRLATLIQSVWKMWKVRKAFVEMKEAAKNLFAGKKERKRRSLEMGAVAFFGDFLMLKESPEMTYMRAMYGDTTCVFSDSCVKVTRKLKALDRLFVVTDKAVYHMTRLPKPKAPKGYGVPLIHDIRRRTPLELIDSVTLSELSDDYIVIGIPTEYDYVLKLDQKTILATILHDTIAKTRGRKRPLNFSNQVTYTSPKGPRTINFAKDETVPDAGGMFTKSADKRGFNILIPSGTREAAPQQQFVNRF